MTRYGSVYHLSVSINSTSEEVQGLFRTVNAMPIVIKVSINSTSEEVQGLLFLLRLVLGL